MALIGIAATVAAVAPSCSLGEGEGKIAGTLNVPTCWSGHFEFVPDFFAGVPYRETSLELRIQQGGDYETFSDGLSILIDDVHAIRPNHLGEVLSVSLPPEVTPPGVPVKAVANPANVHMSLYLQRTCRTENVALYALDQVSLNPDGSCDTVDGTYVPVVCSKNAASADANADAGGGAGDGGVPPLPTGRSTITFKHLFNAKPEETVAAERLTEASFDVYLADPRDVCPGGLGPPPRCRGHLSGSFRFYFQRGKPGQPFP